MSINICLCEAQEGEAHDPACPYPIYFATERQEGEWAKQFVNRKGGLTQLIDTQVAPQEAPDEE